MRRIFCLLAFFLFLTINFIAGAQDDSCADTLPSRLVVREQGRALTGNNVREEASRNSNLIGEIPAEAVFDVLEGPVCAEGFAWWRVETGLVNGWIVEAIGEDYTVESLAPTFTEIEFGGVRFTLTGDIAANASGRANDASDEGPFTLPAHILFQFQETATGRPIFLAVHPAQQFNALHDNVLESLAEQLDTRSDVMVLPNDLPLYTGDRLYVSQPKYLHFEGGSGIRFLSTMKLDVSPINRDVSYYFIGLTDDGRYYIQGWFPVTTELLPIIEGFDPETFDFEQNVREVKAILDAAAPEVFTPSLQRLDNLIESLKIAPETLAEAMPTETSEPTNTMTATRTPTDTITATREATRTATRRANTNTPTDTMTATSEVTRTPTRRPNISTPTDTMTATREATRTPTRRPSTNTPPTRTTQSADMTCTIIPLADTNVRRAPNVNSNVQGHILANTEYKADGQFRRESENFPWWHLVEETEVIANGIGESNAGRWVRADFVREEGNCDALPVMEE